jgi:hypothetical protein
MPRSTLRAEENAFLSTYIDRWQSLNVNIAHARGGTKPKTLLLREICDKFYLKFLERDPHLSDSNQWTFSEADMTLFPKVYIFTELPSLLKTPHSESVSGSSIKHVKLGVERSKSCGAM